MEHTDNLLYIARKSHMEVAVNPRGASDDMSHSARRTSPTLSHGAHYSMTKRNDQSFLSARDGQSEGLPWSRNQRTSYQLANPLYAVPSIPVGIPVGPRGSPLA